ncbi:MAG: hypothetical protein ACLFT6_01600 [Bacteroidales bacterium]
MNTKVFFICIAVLLLSAHGLRSQEVTAKLDEAKEYYTSANLEETRYSLKQALEELNQVLGREILGMFPETMENLPVIREEDNVTGNVAGITGLNIKRRYAGENQSVDVLVVDDSPLLAGINTFLSMPAFMGTGDPDMKRIKIGGYKALISKELNDSTGIVRYEIQVPFDKSLFSFNTEGFDDEDSVVKMAETIPVAAIAKMTR